MLFQSTKLSIDLRDCPQITEWSLLALSHVKGDLSIDVRSTGVGFLPEKLRSLVVTQSGGDTGPNENGDKGEEGDTDR